MFRRLLFVFAFLVSITPLHAVVWQSQEFGIAITLPDGPDWVPTPEALTPTMRVLTAVQNQRTNSVFHIAVQTGLVGKTLDDPAVIESIKKDLAVAYQIIGHSRMRAGTADWIQFPINGNGAKGVVRATAANGQIFTVTLLRGDGKNALEDADLTRTGASFRITGPATPVASIAAADGLAPAPAAAAPVAGNAGEVATPASSAEEFKVMDYKRIAIGAGVLVFLLLMVWGIIGSGRK